MKVVYVGKEFFEVRARAKQQVREADERALAAGIKSAAQLQQQNNAFAGLKMRPRWDLAKNLG